MTAIELLNGLAERSRRQEVAAELARYWGVEAVLVLIRDTELGVLRPAPGFRQTLPGGPTWRDFLAGCAQPGEHNGKVAFPDRDRVVLARAYVAEGDYGALFLIGGTPTLSYSQFERLPFPLLWALLQAETAQHAASGSVAAAREATQRATALAGALDRARTESQRTAADLKRALEEAARLNRELHELNETLEKRVRERTRELEKQTEDRLNAEAALLQARKMEAVGQLTGGVAHDFNNLLAVIIGNLDLIESGIGEDPKLQRAVEMAHRAADQGARLTEQLLAFARRQVLRPQIIELKELLADYEPLLRRAIGEAVDLRMSFSPHPCYCRVDPVHLQTAILNLAINARDAMHSGGVLDIQISICDAATLGSGGAPSDGEVCLTVSDSGTGMPPEVVERAFEPFFTTKAAGKGTGLGLSQVYGFVRQSGGRVAIDSETGAGTTIRIYLPLVSGTGARSDQGVERTGTAPILGSETILVVEDDPDVVEVALSLLAGLGYRTVLARNGAEALAILDSTEELDLLFTDLVMPGGISGTDLARAARERRPGIKVLLTSGYAALEQADDVAQQELPFISKPYRQQSLAATIRTVLDQPLR